MPRPDTLHYAIQSSIRRLRTERALIDTAIAALTKYRNTSSDPGLRQMIEQNRASDHTRGEKKSSVSAA